MPDITFNTAVIIALVAAVISLAILLIFTMSRLNKLAHRIGSASPAGQDQDEVSGTLHGDALQRLSTHARQISALNMAQQRDLCRVGLVRFNPYEDTGGDLSFSLALASNDGNGVLITSLHGRTNTRFYAKPLTAWNSTHSLSNEEVDAVRLAQDMH